MLRAYHLLEQGNNRLYPLTVHQAGEEECVPCHSFGPAVRDHYLMHFIISGKGMFENKQMKYQLKEGQGFLITPDEVTFYQADRENPWHYCWIGFQGREAKNLIHRCHISEEAPIFQVTDCKLSLSCIQKIQQVYLIDEMGFETLGAFFQLLSTVQGAIKSEMKEKQIPSLTKDYITKNYSYPITVNQMANNLAVNRSHLYRVFKEQYGISIQQYLLEYRLEQSVRLMEKEVMDITEIMYSCGFHDLPNYSRQFKRKYGISPANYRKELIKKAKPER